MINRPDRFSIDLPAAILTRPEGPQSLARVQNVSPEGLLLAQLAKPLPEQESVWVELPRTDGRGRVGMLGRVCWSADDRAGVAIEAMLPHHRQRYVDLLATFES